MPARDGRSRVHLDHLQLPVAWIADELDVREAEVVDRPEDLQAEVVHLLVVAGGEDGARAEAERALAHLAADDARERPALAAHVGEERVDLLVRVGDELLDDGLEAAILGPLPGGDRFLDGRGRDCFLSERGGELLAFERLHEERRLQVGVEDGLGTLGSDRVRGGDTGLGGDLREEVLAPEAANGLGVRRERDVGELADLVPAAQDRVDVLVALEEEDRPLALRGRVAKRLEHGVVVGRDGAPAEVARPQSELVAVPRDPLDGDPGAPEAPRRWRARRAAARRRRPASPGKRLLVRGDRRIGDRRPREPLLDSLAGGGAQAAPELLVAEKPLQRLAQRRHVARGDEQTRLSVDHEVQQASDGARDHRPAVRHRLGAHDAEALAVRRARDHGRPLVQRPERVMRHEPQRARNLLAQRPVSRDDEVHAGRGLHELQDPLLRREPSREQDLRRVGGLRDGLGHLHPARDHAHFPRAQLASRGGQRLRRADHEPRLSHDAPRQPASPPRQLDVRPPQLQDERLPDAGGDEPVGSQCACTRSTPSARRRASARKFHSIGGTIAASHGRRRRFPITPDPYAIP